MSAPTDPSVAGPGAPAAPPRSNGELVFDEPWESRAFGVAVALHDAGIVDFETFRAMLIQEIASWETEHGPSGEGCRYYERWLTALERTLLAAGIVDPAAMGASRAAIERRWAHEHGS